MNKAVAAIIIVLVIFLGIWAYPIVKSRYFIAPDPVSQTTKDEKPVSGPISGPTEENNGQPETSPEAQNGATGGAFEITAQECDSECRSIEDPAKLTYCQNVCGLTTVPTKPIPTADPCREKTDLPKDYCLKDQAVAKKDFSLCDGIQDKGIRKACQNRIAEELLNGMN